MSDIKIFVFYHTSKPIFSSEIFQPLLTGAFAKKADKDMIGDHTGDNISELNRNYGELTGHYWVWKNYLPSCKEKYIGFCHYRRFLDLKHRRSLSRRPLCKITYPEFTKYFQALKAEKAYKLIKGYDVILPKKSVFKMNTREQYLAFHPAEDLDKALKLLEKMYPAYKKYADAFFKGNKGYYCLIFIMKKELMNDFLAWSQNLVKELSRISDYTNYNNYENIRTPAYIIERFFNIWLQYQIAEKGISVKEVDGFFLTDNVKKKKRLVRLIEKIRRFFNKKRKTNKAASLTLTS